MKSKMVLSFGYKSYLNYFFKISVFNFFKFFGNMCRCGSCCKTQAKHSSMTARKYRRVQNANKKFVQEMDIIEIVKTLRKARFIIDNQMTSQQQQLIDYFKEYSLETASISRHQHVYSKR